jgi:tetratricopeptide (TPR) repeat protein
VTALTPDSPEVLVRAAREAARRGSLREADELAETASGCVGQGTSEAAQLANIRGGIAFELGELDRAEGWFEQAMRLAGEREDPLLAAKATTNLGSIAHLRGKVVLAGSLYQSALEVYLREEDQVGIARSEHNLGVVERELGDLERAGAHAERAVSAACRTEDHSLISLTLLGLAETAIKRGEPEVARGTLAAARAIGNQAEDALSLTEAARLEALLSYVSGRYGAALRGAAGAYEAAMRLNASYLAGECAFLAAQVCRRLGRKQLTERFRKRAEGLFHGVGAVAALRRLELGLGSDSLRRRDRADPPRS